MYEKTILYSTSIIVILDVVTVIFVIVMKLDDRIKCQKKYKIRVCDLCLNFDRGRLGIKLYNHGE